MMRAVPSRVSRAVAGIVLVAALALTLVRAGNGAPAAGRNSDAEIAAAAKRLFANPADGDARNRLADLRTQRDEQRLKSLEALARGLEGYRDGGGPASGPDLAIALQSPYVVEMANAVLLKPLDAIARECGGGSVPARPTTPAAGGCPQCGDLGWVDCTTCVGAGYVTCTACAGKGQSREKTRPAGATSRMVDCAMCVGKGAIQCKTCSGSGAVACSKCGGVAAPAPAGGLRPSAPAASVATTAINEVIDKARYLRSGGTDLWSPRALKPSPKASP